MRGKSSVTVKDSELCRTIGDDMILKLFPALVSMLFVLTMYKLEWHPRRERRWKIRDEAGAKAGKRDRGTVVGCLGMTFLQVIARDAGNEMNYCGSGIHHRVYVKIV